MTSQSPDANLPEFDMEEKGKELDILLPAQAGTLRVEYTGPQIPKKEEQEITSIVSPGTIHKNHEAARTRASGTYLSPDFAGHVAGIARAGMASYSVLETSLPLENSLQALQSYVTKTFLQTVASENPSFAFYDEGHSERVVGYLEQLVGMYPLSPVERFLVIAGAWVHDSGFAQSSHRETHHERSRGLVWSDQTIQAYLFRNEFATEVVARLAFGHTSRVDIASIDEWNPTVELIPGQAQRVRVRHLSCLLRLADAMDIDHRRAIYNRALLKKLKSEAPVSYAYHLCHQRIQYIGVSPQAHQIDVQALVRTKADKERISRFIKERLKLGREVKTTVPYLWSYSPDLKNELNLDIQRSSQVPRLPAEFVTEEFLDGTTV